MLCNKAIDIQSDLLPVIIRVIDPILTYIPGLTASENLEMELVSSKWLTKCLESKALVDVSDYLIRSPAQSQADHSPTEVLRKSNDFDILT